MTSEVVHPFWCKMGNRMRRICTMWRATLHRSTGWPIEIASTPVLIITVTTIFSPGAILVTLVWEPETPRETTSETLMIAASSAWTKGKKSTTACTGNSLKFFYPNYFNSKLLNPKNFESQTLNLNLKFWAKNFFGFKTYWVIFFIKFFI